jgi:hypothetical protein
MQESFPPMRGDEFWQNNGYKGAWMLAVHGIHIGEQRAHKGTVRRLDDNKFQVGRILLHFHLDFVRPFGIGGNMQYDRVPRNGARKGNGA